jgi:hypothetical protein
MRHGAAFNSQSQLNRIRCLARLRSSGLRRSRSVILVLRVRSIGRLLSTSFVTDSVKMYYFYQRYAPTGKDRFETLDATYAGMAVERELRANPRTPQNPVNPKKPASRN